MLMDQEGFYRRQTLQGNPTSATKQDIDAERVLDQQFDGDVGVVDHDEALGEGASKDCNIWLGGQSYRGRLNHGEWLRDELEMRCLIDEGLTMERYETVDGQKVDVIDPALR